MMFTGARVFLTVVIVFSCIGVELAVCALCQDAGIGWTYFHTTQSCYHLVEHRNALQSFSERLKDFTGAWTIKTPCDQVRGGPNSNQTAALALLKTTGEVNFLRDFVSEKNKKALVNVNLTSLKSLQATNLWNEDRRYYIQQGIRVNASSGIVSLLLSNSSFGRLFQSDGFFTGPVLCQVARGPVGPPYCPSRLEIDILSKSSVLLKWKPGHNGGSPQTFTLSLYYCSGYTASNCTLAGTHSLIQSSYAGVLEHSFHNLNPKPKIIYRFSIASKNVNGTVSKCQDAYQSLESATIPPSCPTDFEIDRISASVVVLSWKPGFHGRLPQTFLVSLEECTLGSRKCSLKRYVRENATTDTAWRYYVWKDLVTSSNALYTFSIQAENSRGTTGKCPSAVKTIKEENSLPSCPTEMEINILSRTEVQLLWRPGMGGGQALKFTITCELCPEPNSRTCSVADRATVPLINNVGRLSYTVYNLTVSSNTMTYKFTIVPKNSKGLASNCKSVFRNVNSVISPPSCPTDVDASVISDSAVLLSWKPGHDGGLTQTFSVNLGRCNDSSLNCSSGDDVEISYVESRGVFYAVLSGVGLDNHTDLILTVRAKNPRGFALRCDNSSIGVNAGILI
ncbi:unnamed protein product [Lymnaea stagnalis]|uniref:Fibronectin type-III domain-containing protein n=1 Tax=Lymnaea stagnalis TaxID=6523 RepID=A0AAV2IF85_LYMST